MSMRQAVLKESALKEPALSESDESSLVGSSAINPIPPTETQLQPSDVTIIIPTLNEERAIGELLEQLCGQYPGVNVIVADDSSTDRTRDIVEAFSRKPQGKSIHLLERINAAVRGITISVLEALDKVQTDYFVVMDGDLQHPPSVVADIIDELSNGADLVSAARLPYIEQQPLHRVWMTKLATTAAKYALRRRGLQISDPMSGLFGGRTDLIQKLVATHNNRFEQAGYKVLFDILRCSNRADLRLIEVFYEFGLRSGGNSKLRPIHAFYFLRSIFR